MPRGRANKAARTAGRTEATRGPGRPAGATGDRTRERLVSAAVETFARQGVAGASVRDIARQARIRVSTLYHYFASKEALYQAVRERVAGEIRDLMLSVMSKDQDMASMTREAMGRLFDFFLAHRAYVLISYRACLEDGAADGDAHAYGRWLGLTEGLLGPAQLRGVVKTVDPALYMITIDGLVHWHLVSDAVYRRALGKGLDDPEIVRRTREHIIRVAVRTLGLEEEETNP